MSLEQVFYLSQSIASIAVVGSLIYLGLQVRGADRSQRAVMQRGRADRASNAALTVANGELARVWQSGMDTDPTMTREEVTQWLLLCRSMFLSGEDSYLQHKARTLDQAAFDSYCAGVRSYMSRPGFRAGWRLLASQFGKEFRAFVEAQIAAAPIASHVDIYAEWQKLVQGERAAPKT
jgi:hypothetical protein